MITRDSKNNIRYVRDQEENTRVSYTLRTNTFDQDELKKVIDAEISSLTTTENNEDNIERVVIS